MSQLKKKKSVLGRECCDVCQLYGFEEVLTTLHKRGENPSLKDRRKLPVKSEVKT